MRLLWLTMKGTVPGIGTKRSDTSSRKVCLLQIKRLSKDDDGGSLEGECNLSSQSMSK